MATTKFPTAIEVRALYIDSGGRMTCGELKCAGMSAHFTGRDRHGVKLHRVTAAESARNTADGFPEDACESCGVTLAKLAGTAKGGAS